VFVAAATGLGLVLVAPLVNVVSAGAVSVSRSPAARPPAPAWAPTAGARTVASALYSGYYENLVGDTTLTSTLTVPTMKCTNHSTWGTPVGILALMDSMSGQIEHGGGVEVGCSSPTGTPSYAAALCDPTFTSGCGTLTNPVAPGDVVNVTVSAGGCAPTCSVTVTVTDTTEPWTESWTGPSQSDFDTFVAVVGAPPVPDFGKVPLSNVTIDGGGFGGRKYNLVDHAGRMLARASALSHGRTSFSVKWIAAS